MLHPLGLTSRVARVQRLAATVAQLPTFPREAGTLRGLPGVGPYAAATTAAVLGEKPKAIVDTVTERVFRRYFGARPARPPTAVAAQAYAQAPRGEWHRLNWAVLDLAASTCLPKRPLCAACPLSGRCSWVKTASSAP